jgi:hypothetical protein
MRRSTAFVPSVFAVAAVLFSASCGGGAMSPTVSTPVPALPSGAYVLSVSFGGGGGISACVSSGMEPGALATNVELQHSGNTVTIQPDDSTATFRMDLQMSGTTLSGPVSGQFLSTGRVVAVAGQGGSAAVAVGTATSSGAAGNLTGNVSANGPGGPAGTGGIVTTADLTCNGGNWSVTPR